MFDVLQVAHCGTIAQRHLFDRIPCALENSRETHAMSTKLSNSDRAWTAAELRRLPAAERDDILAEAAALAESAYRSQPHLIDFEAFGEDDLHGESTAASAG
jgi:hypothetical protein